MRQRICILGATGSIGRSTLDVVARHPDRYEIVAVTANTQVSALAELAASSNARYAAILDTTLADELTARLRKKNCQAIVLSGRQGLLQAASLDCVDVVMAAIVGAAGLEPTLEAANAGKRLLLANKEALVMAGPVFMSAVRKRGTVLLPIDSEHNAIFQCLPPMAIGAESAGKGIKRILLTGSGGPFRERPLASLGQVTPEEACAHPTWAMGRKISVDSATMMNKGLEVIEAHWLFSMAPESIQVVIHPQSVIHSMVEYVDGSVIAQMGNPDMRTPIAQALAYPERIDAGVEALDLFRVKTLGFEEPDFERFPALRLAYSALEKGGSAPTVLNAANEIAVAAFLQREIRFLDIVDVIEATTNATSTNAVTSLSDVMAADVEARARATELIGKISRGKAWA